LSNPCGALLGASEVVMAIV